MATLRDILRKIGAVKKTRQITKAMNMVAAARLRTAQTKMESFDPYAMKFSEVLGNLASRLEPDIHPLLVRREQISTVALVHFSADRGLCGSFNMNSINMAERWLRDEKAAGHECTLTLIGKRGNDYFRKRGYSISESHTHIYGQVDMAFAHQMSRSLIERFMSEETDEVYMIYTRFLGMAKQQPTLVKLIPIEPPKSTEEAKGTEAQEYLCEPSAEELLIDLLPKHLSVQILNAFLQNETSEHAARMAAMDNASKNCSELIETLTLVYNKARQAAITAELMDIVGGAEALKKA
jgi:F-type H+-transporting ATPase subunit gamma